MNASPPSDTQIDRTAPLALWRVAEAFMHVLHALFGDPSHIAAKHTLTLKAHQLLASWLRAGEAMMRRLLLIEAAAHAKPNTRPLLRVTRKHQRKLMHFFSETPENWRVSFRCFAGDTHARRAAGQGLSSKSIACVSPAPPARPFIFREDRKLPFRGLSLSKAGANRCARRSAPKRKSILRQDREWVQHQPPPAFRAAWPLAERYEALRRAFNAPLAFAYRLARLLHATPHRARELLRASPHAESRISDFDKLTQAAEISAACFNSS